MENHMYEKLIDEIKFKGCRIIQTDLGRTDIDLFNLSSEGVTEFINKNEFKRQGLGPFGKARYVSNHNVDLHVDWNGGFMSIVNRE